MGYYLVGVVSTAHNTLTHEHYHNNYMIHYNYVKVVLNFMVYLSLQKSDRMRVVYRMRGLLGDATEDMVEQLDVAKDEIDEEEGYKMAAILSKCGGLDSVLSRLARVDDFIQGHNLISAALKLLGYCVKLKENRQYLLQPHLNTLNTLLGILDLVSTTKYFLLWYIKILNFAINVFLIAVRL